MTLAASDRRCPACRLLGKRQLDGVGALARARPPRAAVTGTTAVAFSPSTAPPSRARSRRPRILDRPLGLWEARSEPARTHINKPTPNRFEPRTARVASFHDDSVPDLGVAEEDCRNFSEQSPAATQAALLLGARRERVRWWLSKTNRLAERPALRLPIRVVVVAR